jgi:hypothetical protein
VLSSSRHRSVGHALRECSEGMSLMPCASARNAGAWVAGDAALPAQTACQCDMLEKGAPQVPPWCSVLALSAWVHQPGRDNALHWSLMALQAVCDRGDCCNQS